MQRGILGITVCLMLFFLFLAGCAYRIGDMTVLSTRGVNLDKIDLDKMPQTKNVSGTDSKFIFLFIPLGFPHLENAVDDALDKGGGDLMIDAVIQSEGWWFIIGQTAISVKGNVVKTRGQTNEVQ